MVTETLVLGISQVWVAIAEDKQQELNTNIEIYMVHPKSDYVHVCQTILTIWEY